MSLVRTISWNVSEKDARLDRIESLITATPAGLPLILCLQEVPSRLIPALSELAASHGLYMESGLDKKREQDGGFRECYLVVLSQLPITLCSTWRMPQMARRPLSTRLMIAYLKMRGKWDGTSVASGGLEVIVDVNGRPLQVMTAHLSLTDPLFRRREFRTLLERQLSNMPNVICGDFNILEGAYGRAVNLGIGASVPFAVWRSERKEFDFLLHSTDLQNPFKGIRTHKAGQLDHMLLSWELQWTNFGILPRHESDHHPVQITFEV